MGKALEGAPWSERRGEARREAIPRRAVEESSLQEVVVVVVPGYSVAAARGRGRNCRDGAPGHTPPRPGAGM